ncbi:DUF4292 domain-containing protein [Gracilimonas sp. Q87]|uniref:DUF4292 domain-containing protein n=1 Tax=Gracilimonas sp. Q87 TaxID=3384766 RepID=UPI00398455BE
MRLPLQQPHYLLLGMLFMFSACSSTSELTVEGNFRPSEVPVDKIVSMIPDYSGELVTLSGKGRAIISEPGNSDRVTIDFATNENRSLLTIQNRIGIEGGQMLVEQDSILIYNRLEKEAQKISIYDGRLTSLNELTSINMLDLINFKVDAGKVNVLQENESSFRLLMNNGLRVIIDGDNGRVQSVEQTIRQNSPYSRIFYESYSELNGYVLPRKITIFSADEHSRVVFLVRSLETNPDRINLEIDIPDNIKIQRL